MAPSATSTSETTTLPLHTNNIKLTTNTGPYKELAPIGYSASTEEQGPHAAKYKNYLPHWEISEHYPPLTPFIHRDHGLDADPTYPDLLPPGTVKTTEITPSIGTEVEGIQLSSLGDKGKDQLARFVAERKVVVFRGQDFKDLEIEEALAFGRYFGRLHVHPTSGAPKAYPEIHLVHRGTGDKTAESFFQTRTSSVAWHSDVSYELQPPGTTFLYILDVPEVGGDTLFVNQVEAYERLSEGFKERLHGLKATHSGVEQVNASRGKNGAVRREPVISEHPIVRTHPVTGEKALYVNPQFTRNIIGYKQEESDALLKFLYDHIAYGADFQARVKWAEGTVVVWDNRVTSHSALVDWKSGQRRHLARIAAQAEAPIETAYGAPK